MQTEVKKELPELKEGTAKLSAELQKLLDIDTKTGIGSISQDAYEQLLPADIDLSIVKRLQEHHTTLYAAAFDAVATKATELGGKHKGLTEVSVGFPLLGKDRLDVTWTRSKEVNDGIQKAGEPPVAKKTVYGVMAGKLTTTGTSTSSGELGKVAKRARAAAAEMFGGK